MSRIDNLDLINRQYTIYNELDDVILDTHINDSVVIYTEDTQHFNVQITLPVSGINRYLHQFRKIHFYNNSDSTLLISNENIFPYERVVFEWNAINWVLLNTIYNNKQSISIDEINVDDTLNLNPYTNQIKIQGGIFYEALETLDIISLENIVTRSYTITHDTGNIELPITIIIGVNSYNITEGFANVTDEIFALDTTNELIFQSGATINGFAISSIVEDSFSQHITIVTSDVFGTRPEVNAIIFLNGLGLVSVQQILSEIINDNKFSFDIFSEALIVFTTGTMSTTRVKTVKLFQLPFREGYKLDIMNSSSMNVSLNNVEFLESNNKYIQMVYFNGAWQTISLQLEAVLFGALNELPDPIVNNLNYYTANSKSILG